MKKRKKKKRGVWVSRKFAIKSPFQGTRGTITYTDKGAEYHTILYLPHKYYSGKKTHFLSVSIRPAINAILGAETSKRRMMWDEWEDNNVSDSEQPDQDSHLNSDYFPPLYKPKVQSQPLINFPILILFFSILIFLD